jgi:aspartate aminotransferase
MGPPDPILGITEAFKRDTDPRKVNLGVGAYRDDTNKPWVLPSVKAAEEKLYNSHMDHEYLPIHGLEVFRNASVKLAYGDSAAVREGRIASVQCLSGTGSLRLAAAFLERFYNGGDKCIYVPSPTWGNHKNVAKDSKMTWKDYKYYEAALHGINMSKLLGDLNAFPNKSIILLHACAHNPTGADPTPEEWSQIREVMQRKHHIAFFDMAYQGFASGDTVKDAFALRHFVEHNVPVLLAQSFAKNFGLYGERIGCFSMVADSAEEASKLLSHLKILARPMYSNPPLYGARIVSTILNTPDLNTQWLKDVKTMADRIIDMRSGLVNGLKTAGSTKNWSHITKQIGMFAFTGLNADQCKRLASEHHIYLTLDGRISIAGLNSKNVGYVANAIHAVTK